jgi:hypothetical protein
MTDDEKAAVILVMLITVGTARGLAAPRKQSNNKRER